MKFQGIRTNKQKLILGSILGCHSSPSCLDRQRKGLRDDVPPSQDASPCGYESTWDKDAGSRRKRHWEERSEDGESKSPAIFPAQVGIPPAAQQEPMLRVRGREKHLPHGRRKSRYPGKVSEAHSLLCTDF